MDGKRCSECGTTATRLRKDRCDACYMRLYRGGEVPEGATCGGCGERRRELLCYEALRRKNEIVCGNCALLLRRTRPRLASMTDLRERCRRDRRRGPGESLGRRRADQAAARSSFDASVD